jgi:hypothetical protein
MSPSTPTLAPVPSGVETAGLHRFAIHYNKFVMHDGVSLTQRSLYFENSALIACAIQCHTVGCTPSAIRLPIAPSVTFLIVVPA